MHEQDPPEEIVERFCDAWNRHDLDAFVRLFSPDSEFVNVFGQRYLGPLAIRQVHERAHATVFRSSILESVTVEPRELQSDVALIAWQWALTGLLTPDGAPSPDRHGWMLLVVTQGGNGWQIVAAQNTDSVR